jgi:pyruvate dehydrogenase E1 component beta subunit
MSEAFASFAAPPHRITLPDAPVPYSGGLEARYLPSPAYVANQIDVLVTQGRTPSPWWKETI